jgi:hypothetical protein
MRYFTQDHEWIEVAASGETATVGITDYAQGQLGDIVFVELPETRPSSNRSRRRRTFMRPSLEPSARATHRSRRTLPS